MSLSARCDHWGFVEVLVKIIAIELLKKAHKFMLENTTVMIQGDEQIEGLKPS